jgi:ABC-type transport system substrate-binding protein
MKRLVSVLLALTLALSMGAGATAEVVFTYARAEELQSFDPWGQNNVVNYIISQLIYDYLIYYKDGEFVPGLAESWEVAEDNMSVTFKIREGIKFHNEESCTAEDVAVHYNRCVEDTTLIRHSTLAALKSAEVIDEYKVRFNLNNPDGYFMMLLAQFPAATPADLYKEIGTDIFTYNYGTGPWKFVSYSPGESIVFERNQDYWGECTSNVDKIIYRPVVEDTTRVSAVITGDVDMADGIPADQVANIEAGGKTVNRMPAFDQLYVGFQSRGVFNDYNARMAFNYGIDRTAIVESIVGAGVAANWPCVKGAIGYDETVPVYPYDIELAKEYLAKANYDGTEVRLIGPVGDYDKIDEVLTAIYYYLTMAGFNVKLEQLQSAAFTEARKSGDYDMYITGNGWVLGDGYIFLNQRVIGDSLASKMVFEDLNDAIRKANAAMDVVERDELMREAYSVMMRHAGPQQFLYSMECIVAHNPNISGVEFSGSKHTNLRNVVKN